MIQPSMFDDGDDNSSGPKLTVSSGQLVRSSNDSRILSAQDCNAAIAMRKVTSLNCNDVKPKTKNKNDHYQKAFNAKLNLYLTAQKKFQMECISLNQSYETIKKLQSDSKSDKNCVQQHEDLQTTVKNIVEKQFGIKFPKSSDHTLKKDHKVFVPNYVNRPPSLDIKSTSGHPSLDLAIKAACEDCWKNCLDISETNAKYNFLLRTIVEPDNFSDLYDVREYLMKHVFNKEQKTDRIEDKLNTIYNSLQLKIINIINEFNQVLTSDKRPNEQNSEIIEIIEREPEKLDMDAEIKLQTEIAIEDYKNKMDAKLKLLETENQKLYKKEAEYFKQIKSLTGELSFRNRKLSNMKERAEVLTKEKNDLISTIEKMEVKDGGYQTLQNRFVREQEKNKQLRSIIEKEYNRVVI